MPPPGPDFTRAAKLLGDPDIEFEGKRDGRRLVREEANLRMLHTYALYEPWFTINVLVKGRDVPCRFIPGHPMLRERADGPRGRAEVMVIGKMPGKEEANTGRNMVGPSGQILRQVLMELGVPSGDWGRWYVTNLMKFPHPTPWTGSGLAASWLTDCMPLLHQELRLLRPKYVLCLGTEAAKALLGPTGAIKMSSNRVHDARVCVDTVRDRKDACRACGGRGRVVEGDCEVACEPCGGLGDVMSALEYHDFKVMTSIHPAAVAREPDLIDQFRASMRMFADLAYDRLQVEHDSRDYHVARTEQELSAEVDAIVARTPTGSIIAVDAEWHGEHPTDKGAYLRTVQVSDRAGYALCVVLTKQGGDVGFTALNGEPSIRAAVPHLRRLLKSTPGRTVRVAGHFFRADLPQIKHHLGIDLMPEYMAPPDDDTDTAYYRTAWEGGFDTGLAAHAVSETDDYKLEVLGSRYTPIPRWDGKLLKWKTDYCNEHNLKADSLEGYGDCPEEILFAEPPYYGLADADATRRLVDVFNGIWTGPWEMQKPGLMDNDGFRFDPDRGQCGLNSRRSFWTGMRAAPAAAEMEHWGLTVDVARAEEMIRTYRRRRDQLVAELRNEICWSDFLPSSAFHCRELLYGIGMSGSIDKDAGTVGKRISPPGTRLLNLRPVKATGKQNKKSWDDLVKLGEAHLHTPSTDKETLGILSAQSPIARKLRHVRFLTQLLNTTLRQPTQEEVGDQMYDEVEEAPTVVVYNGTERIEVQRKKPKRKRRKKIERVYVNKLNEDGEAEYESGLLHYVSLDRRVRTHFFQTLETGRWASARPNLQNISKRREDDYKRILGDAYPGPIRSIFVAEEGFALIEADIVGAELAIMAWDSQDEKMIEHVRRALLPEDHPDFYDIHSNIAVSAFKLVVPHEEAVAKYIEKRGVILVVGEPCPPNKDALSCCGYSALRVAAKNVMFGFAYGRGAEAIARQCKEEGSEVSVDEAQRLINNLIRMYPGLSPFFDRAKQRVTWPGWQCSDFGYYRRSVGSNDRTVLGELERQFMNFRVQNAVAGAISRGVDHLYHYREAHPEVSYRMCLQIHDAVILEVPVAQVDYVHDVVLQECLVERVPVWPCDFDGVRLPQITKPYYFGIDRSVMFRWGVKPMKEECAKRGVSTRFGKEPK